MIFRKKADELAKIKELELKYKDSPPIEMEKGDITAMIIAAVLVFGPFLLAAAGIIAVLGFMVIR